MGYPRAVMVLVGTKDVSNHTPNIIEILSCEVTLKNFFAFTSKVKCILVVRGDKQIDINSFILIMCDYFSKVLLSFLH